jgi:hypothetical protein
MFIPFDHLYHWIHDLLPEPGLIYTFYPPGQKDITNLRLFKFVPDRDFCPMPEIICHDQEPLNFDLYQNLTQEQLKLIPGFEDHATNLRVALFAKSIYDKVILVHSEKNSQDLEQYCKNSYIGVHYWAHAVIAKDWYRYARHDKRLLCHKRKYKKLFLIYNRGWTGTREYRLKFSELLYNNNLLSNSMTGFFSDSDQDYRTYQFKNLNMQPNDFEFLDRMPANTSESSNSADYVPEDFNNTAISIVLETVFDDSRIHLTEKTLRPIACGHPFMLAAGPGSLEYIRSYGFKTFDPWIDESYDLETDSLTRLAKILRAMKNFANKPESEQQNIVCELNKIAEFNRNWFFSENFDQAVKNELITNLDQAFQEVNNTTGFQFLADPNNNPIKKEIKLQKLNQLIQSQRKI